MASFSQELKPLQNPGRFTGDQLSLDQKTTIDRNTGLLDWVGKMKTVETHIGGKNLGAVTLETSLHNLDVRTLGRLNRGLQHAMSDGHAPLIGYQGLLANKAPLLAQIFKYNPEFRLDRLSFSRPNGETSASATFKFENVQQDDCSNALALLKKLNITLTVKSPESDFQELISNKARPDVPLTANNSMSQFQYLVSNGYLNQQDGYVTTQLVYRDQKIWLNGKLYVPQSPPPERPTLVPNRNFAFPPAAIRIPPNARTMAMPSSSRTETVYHCTDASGHTTFSDEPCSQGEKSQEMKMAIPTPPSVLSTGSRLRFNPYLVPHAVVVPPGMSFKNCVAIRYGAWLRSHFPVNDLNAASAELQTLNEQCGREVRAP